VTILIPDEGATGPSQLGTGNDGKLAAGPRFDPQVPRPSALKIHHEPWEAVPRGGIGVPFRVGVGGSTAMSGRAIPAIESGG